MKIIAVLFLFGYTCGSAIPKPVHPNEDFAAARATNDRTRIINGNNAQIKDYPWQVSLQMSGSHICGAVIISDHYAVTAAHCVDGSSPGQLQISVGNSNWRQGTKYSVDWIMMHENYGSGNGAIPNDIALLWFQDVITSELYAQTVELAEGSVNYDNCMITGWGRTSSGSIPETLQEAATEVLSRNQCTWRWGSNYNHDVHVCIHNGVTGSCNGDSGGPLTCGNVLVGVTSWGAAGCSTDYPSVYTRISNFRDWIRENSGV